MGARRWMPATRCELQLSAGPRDFQEHPVVTVVVLEPADLAKSDPVAVEGDDSSRRSVCLAIRNLIAVHHDEASATLVASLLDYVGFSWALW